MTQDRGSFRVARAVFGHPAFRGEPYDQRSAWLSLIAEAAWTPRIVNRVGRLIRLERGQLAASHRFLSDQWSWGPDHKRVSRFLEKLVTLDMIRVHTVSGIGIITITNYEMYQSSNTAGRYRDTDAPRTGTVSGTVDNRESSSAASISEIEQGGSGTVSGTHLPRGSSENRDKTNKQIKESKNPSPKRVTDREISLAFDEWWKAYPRKVEKKGARAKYTSIVKRGEATPAKLLAGANAYAAAGRETRFTKHPTTWLNNGCWADESTATSPAPQSNGAMDEFWRERIPKFQKDGAWSTGALGPRPGEPGCRVPGHVLEEFNIRPP
jgi:hypothetical protein